MKLHPLATSIIVLALIGFTAPSLAAAFGPAPVSAGTGEAQMTWSEPAPMDAETRRNMEEQILKSTVRIVIETWTVSEEESGFEKEASTSHATLKEGRYLVTHNHFGNLLDAVDGSGAGYKVVVLADIEGRPLLRAPLSDFVLVHVDPETVVLEYKEAEALEKLGFVSADFADASEVSLQAGVEVAQIDWDGAVTRIDWTTVLQVLDEDGVPVLLIESDVKKGASGGGIFLDGVHVANNWRREPRFGEADELIVNTVTALNSEPVVFAGK